MTPEIIEKENGEIIIVNESGNRTTITQEYQRFIWERVEMERIRDAIEASGVLQQSLEEDYPLLLSRLIYLYFSERENFVLSNNDLLIRLVTTDIAYYKDADLVEQIPEGIVTLEEEDEGF